MTARKALVAAAAVALASLPMTQVAADHAAWMAYSGAPEPNTKWDTSPVMFQNANAEPIEKVYFNGMVMAEAGLFRFDVQLEGGSIVSPVTVRLAAALGFWRDCNNDGYIGMRVLPASYGSFGVYPRALAGDDLDERICPRGSPYNPTNTLTGQPNGQIDEFRWIGPDASYDPAGGPAPLCLPPSGNPVRICPPADTRLTKDRYDVSDRDARVWIDWGFPGGRHVLQQGITVEPRSTYDSDGTLEYVDAALQFAASDALGSFWDLKPDVGRCGDPPRLLGGDGTCGLYALHQAYRLVNDSRTESGPGANPSPLVQVFDVRDDDDASGSPCDDFVVQDVAGRRIGLPDVRPALHPNFLVEGSVVGTASNVIIGTNNGNVDGRCARSGLSVGAADDQGEAEVTHKEPSDDMVFASDQRLHLLDGQGYQEASLDVLGTRGTPQAVLGVPAWTGRTTFTMRPPRSGWGSLTAAHATFYADVTPLAFAANRDAKPETALPAGTTGYRYGSDACRTFTTGPSLVNPATLWECSITEWELERAGDQRPDRPILGDPYDLRDVDCQDNSVTGLAAGIRVGVATCTSSAA